MKLAFAIAVSVLCFVACATVAPAPVATGGACGELQQVNLNRGTEVFAAPDDTSNVVTVLPDPTSVCAGTDSVGFGFHRVSLPNKGYGYVRDQSLE